MFITFHHIMKQFFSFVILTFLQFHLKDNHPRAMFSLTRVVGDRLTCSCAFPQAFHPYDVVKNEFCRMLPMKSSKNVEVNHYHINCVSDLDEDGGPIDVSIYFNSKLALSIIPYMEK